MKLFVYLFIGIVCGSLTLKGDFLVSSENDYYYDLSLFRNKFSFFLLADYPF